MWHIYVVVAPPSTHGEVAVVAHRVVVVAPVTRVGGRQRLQSQLERFVEELSSRFEGERGVLWLEQLGHHSHGD